MSDCDDDGDDDNVDDDDEEEDFDSEKKKIRRSRLKAQMGQLKRMKTFHWILNKNWIISRVRVPMTKVDSKDLRR
jgi:hypothetical protein